MISTKCCFQFFHDMLLSSVISELQSASSINSWALGQSACLYSQIVFAVWSADDLECLHWECNNNPKWSELQRGGTVTHDCRRDGDDIAIKSIMEVFPLEHMWVGSETTCVKPNEQKCYHKVEHSIQKSLSLVTRYTGLIETDMVEEFLFMWGIAL